MGIKGKVQEMGTPVVMLLVGKGPHLLLMGVELLQYTNKKNILRFAQKNKWFLFAWN